MMKHLRGKVLRVVGVLVTATAAGACATSPLGRTQLKIMPESKMAAMGAQAFDEMKRSEPLSTDTRLNAYVQCVARPIAAVSRSGIPAEQWEIRVFQDDTANAFALPGGKIGVNTGLLRVAETPGQLAAVLGHEVGHVLAGHGNERVSENLVTQLGIAGTAAILGGGGQTPESKQKRDLLLAALGIGVQFGVLLPHSRTQESEADLIGLELMARAGFDPSESVQLWKNMMKDHGGAGAPEWMSTHPASENRIRNLEANLGRAEPEYLKAKQAGKIPACSAPQR